MTYLIVYKRNHKRVLKNGKTTPAFEFPQQASKYIDKELNGSMYVMIKRG